MRTLVALAAVFALALPANAQEVQWVDMYPMDVICQDPEATDAVGVGFQTGGRLGATLAVAASKGRCVYLPVAVSARFVRNAGAWQNGPMQIRAEVVRTDWYERDIYLLSLWPTI